MQVSVISDLWLEKAHAYFICPLTVTLGHRYYAPEMWTKPVRNKSEKYENSQIINCFLS